MPISFFKMFKYFTQNIHKKEEKRQTACYLRASHEGEGLNCESGKERWKVPDFHEGSILHE